MLKEATSAAHSKAETRRLQRQLIGGTVDVPVFAAFLRQLHVIHTELERQMQLRTEVAVLIDWTSAYFHSVRIGEDLASLGWGASADEPLSSTQQLQSPIEKSSHDDPIALLGYFYVLEGSMNGNHYIIRALQKSTLADRCAFKYFDPYGEEQPERWAACKQALDNFEATSEQTQSIVDTALATFEGISAISDEVIDTFERALDIEVNSKLAVPAVSS